MVDITFFSLNLKIKKAHNKLFGGKFVHFNLTLLWSKVGVPKKYIFISILITKINIVKYFQTNESILMIGLHKPAFLNL